MVDVRAGRRWQEGGAAEVAVPDGGIEIGIGVDPAERGIGMGEGPFFAAAAFDGGGSADAAGFVVGGRTEWLPARPA